MLLLDITTFDPENTMELYKRWEQVEKMGFPNGLKVINNGLMQAGGV